MTNKLYIKTDGPIPEDCGYITAGKVYEATSSDGPHYYGITDDSGDVRDVSLRLICFCSVCRPGWHFCDRYGNPVPAPWEEAVQDAVIYGQGFAQVSAKSVEHIDVAEVLEQPGKALAEVAKQAYLLLLKLQGEDRYTPDYQYTLCALRDQIAEYEGRSAEDVQSDYESQALAAQHKQGGSND